jgi:hypothetical protein
VTKVLVSRALPLSLDPARIPVELIPTSRAFSCTANATRPAKPTTQLAALYRRIPETKAEDTALAVIVTVDGWVLQKRDAGTHDAERATRISWNLKEYCELLVAPSNVTGIEDMTRRH